MKLGIITFYCSHNYGAMLQAYGLQEFLKREGHEVYVIDFKPKYKIDAYKRRSTRYWLSRNPKMCVKHLIDYLRTLKKRDKRWFTFNDFMETHLSLYPYYRGMDFHEFDAIFIGSDQVWSPYHTGGWFDDIMFGVGAKCNVISYAASCTATSLNEQQKDYFFHHLDNMVSISVREESLKNMLQPLTKHKISIVLDPTLLAGVGVFDKIANIATREKPYVVIYEIIGHQQVHTIAESIAKQLDAEILELKNSISNRHGDSSIKDDASPEEFLGYIKNAACVVTTSFHGTAFSILFQRPFYMVLQNSAADNRMVSLLEKIGLQDRMISMNERPTMSIPDYTLANQKMEQLVKESEEFIHKSLKLN